MDAVVERTCACVERRLVGQVSRRASHLCEELFGTPPGRLIDPRARQEGDMAQLRRQTVDLFASKPRIAWRACSAPHRDGYPPGGHGSR